MQTILEKLLNQSYLFDDPRTYQAGVEDAVAALRDLGVLSEEEAEKRPA